MPYIGMVLMPALGQAAIVLVHGWVKSDLNGQTRRET